MNRGRIAVLLLVVLGGLGFLLYRSGKVTLPPPVTSLIENVSRVSTTSETAQKTLSDTLGPLTEQTKPYTQELAATGEVVASRAAAVLGTSIGIDQTASTPATLLEGAALYSRYWYCKQVVESYESQYQKTE